MNVRSILTRALPVFVAGCLTSAGCDKKDANADAKADAKSSDAKTDETKDAAGDTAAAEAGGDTAAAGSSGAAGGSGSGGAAAGADESGGAAPDEGGDGPGDGNGDGGGGGEHGGDGTGKGDSSGKKAGGDKAGGDKAGGDKAGGDKAGGDKAGGDKGPKIDGKAIFMSKCKSCHGVSGNADTKLGKKHEIADWTAAGWKAKWPKAKVIEIVTNGKDGTKMKPFKDKLSADEIAAVADYSRKLGK